MRRIGRLFMLLGAVLIIGAVSLFAYNKYEDKRAGEASDEVLGLLKIITEEGGDRDVDGSGRLSYGIEDGTPETAPGGMPGGIPEDGYGVDSSVGVLGDEYIGYLVLPALGLELPVMSEFSYPHLRIAPCRHYGSIAGRNMVIAAHNYARHFGRLKELKGGEEVYFVDVYGNVWKYHVVRTEILAPSDNQLMFRSGYDLTLYTCTYGGASRVTVRCEMEIV